ncbi:MAG: formylmethionine deformylase [Acidimicrobiales bacterium]|nr:formylmethionine deformylase [Acidimicrobiales bacterium]
MIKPVLQLPNRVLATACEPVGALDDRALTVARDLLDTMRSAEHSVGVAAPQIGVSLRVFCVDVTGHRKARTCHGEVVLFDPVVVEASGPEIGREGCMSVPDLTGDVARFTSLHVRGLGLDGEVHDYEVDAFEARAFQHELDHLDGLLFLDRVVADDRVFRRRVYR